MLLISGMLSLTWHLLFVRYSRSCEVYRKWVLLYNKYIFFNFTGAAGGGFADTYYVHISKIVIKKTTISDQWSAQEYHLQER